MASSLIPSLLIPSLLIRCVCAMAIAAAGVLISPAPSAHAAGLQVEPVSLTIDGRSGVIWLSNMADTALLAQVRVYVWTQDQDGDEQAPTENLLASPPLAQIAPGGRQLVRLVAANPASCEDSYRLAIDEVPTVARQGSGLRYVLHYSVPAFITRRGCGPIKPQLAWHLQAAGASTILTVANHGTMHAQLARLRYVTATGNRIALAPGLLGYVLPGRERSFTLPVPAKTLAGDGTLEVAVNGSDISQPLALAALAR